MHRRFWGWAGLTAGLMLLSGGTGFVWATVSNMGSIPSDLALQPDFKQFVEVYQLIRSRSVLSNSPSQLLTGAIAGMVGTLHDQFSNYLPPSQYQALDQQLDPKFSGVGIVMTTIGKQIQVKQVLPGSPAQKAGIHTGETILAVNGASVAGMDMGEVAGKIQGASGSSVQLTVQASAAATQTVQLTRRSLALPTVYATMLAHHVGYMAIAEFGDETASEAQSAFNQLRRGGAQGILLDLRDDPGGEVQVAVKVAGLFVPAGPVVRLKFKSHAADQVYRSSGPGTTLPVEVLVNGQTASAAEILAAAIRDRQVGEVVGTQTYGKGIVQQVIQLPGGSALKLTVATYYTPSGQDLEHVGIHPAVTITEPAGIAPSENPAEDPQLAQAISLLQKRMGARS